MFDRLSLRARLLLGVFVLAAIGLVAADAATYASLRSFMLDRVDKTLEAGHAQVEHIAFPQPAQGQGQGSGRGPTGQPPGDGGGGPPAQGIDWYEVRTLGGGVVRSGFIVGGGSAPKLPAEIRLPAAGGGPDAERATYFTVSSTSGSASYRVRASIEPQQPNRVFVIATKLNDVLGTLHRLLLIELVVTIGVLAAIAGLGLWVVRLGLRPLREIESTASAIAAGDLSRRVERADPKTEVGRLGLSLNAMLARSNPRSRRARRRRTSCAGRTRSSVGSSPTRRTSCAPRWPPSAPTPSCSVGARPAARLTWPARCRVSPARPSG